VRERLITPESALRNRAVPLESINRIRDHGGVDPVDPNVGRFAREVLRFRGASDRLVMLLGTPPANDRDRLPEFGAQWLKDFDSESPHVFLGFSGHRGAVGRSKFREVEVIRQSHGNPPPAPPREIGENQTSGSKGNNCG